MARTICADTDSFSEGDALELAAAAPLPRYELRFDIVLKPGVNCEEFGFRVLEFGTGGGLAVWPHERRIKGSVFANTDEPDALDMLERARKHAIGCQDVESIRFEPVAEA